VERVDGNRATLNVNTKRYSASPSFDLPGLPPEIPRTMAEFQALAEGKVELEGGKGFPLGGRLESALGAALGAANGPQGQRGMIEIRTRAELVAAGQ
jgi:hypothetical protein